MSKKIEKRINHVKRPSKLGGHFIPLGYSKKDLFERVKMYINDALIFSIVFTLFLYFLNGNRLLVFKFENDMYTILTNILSNTIILSITNAIWWEFKVRRYHKKVAAIKQSADVE